MKRKIHKYDRYNSFKETEYYFKIRAKVVKQLKNKIFDI